MKIALCITVQNAAVKQPKKLKMTLLELSIRIEGLNNTIVDLTSHRRRLSQVIRQIS